MLDVDALRNDYDELSFFQKRRLPNSTGKWAHIVTKDSFPEVIELNQRISKTLKLDPPAIILVKHDKRFGRYDGWTKTIMLSTGLLQETENMMLASMLAHELGHHKHSRREFLRRGAAIVGGLAALPSSTVLYKKLYDLALPDAPAGEEGFMEFKKRVSSALSGGITGYVTLKLLVDASNHAGEYAADQCEVDAADNPEEVLKVMAILRDEQETPSVLDHLFRTFVVSTHPSWDKRIEAAKRYIQSKGQRTERS